ncbi:MAG: helix-turn-helix domain-containing protein [Chloroflexi bacterium]|nr:helix-turn-helix domain-containing protein [Chloroflexota bacterium]MCI0574940.1 helix-turn-helix domain-containing protein [Chloroflexota bacterium]MCI0645850.1 helix-turn-helix domain-containing protein [Chloroflexota bacterium]MCI0725705.1 helix-turn-helix domain-containing protein [Chloroflexota bacterium]
MDSPTTPPEAPTGRVLNLTPKDVNLGMLAAVTKALGSDKRLAILHLLGANTCSVLEIAETLDIPQSTATLHINILEKAGLIKTDLQPAKRGLQRVCARLYDQVVIQLPTERTSEETAVEVSMPIGAFVDVEVAPTCGLASESGIIGHLDDPAAFYEPERIQAQLLWFRRGYVEYRFPNRLPPDAIVDSLEVSFEICSEAPLHHSDWPSDVTVWINGREVGAWTSPADFGGERGALTPAWWDNSNSQYGLLKVWKLTAQGSFVDGRHVSNVTLDDLGLAAGAFIRVRIGVKEDARNVGGLNLFGSKFGNYAQDIVLKQRFQRSGNSRATQK